MYLSVRSIVAGMNEYLKDIISYFFYFCVVVNICIVFFINIQIAKLNYLKKDFQEVKEVDELVIHIALRGIRAYLRSGDNQMKEANKYAFMQALQQYDKKLKSRGLHI